MEEWEDRNLDRLMAALGPRYECLTDSERRTLEWLAGWDTYTVDNLVSILKLESGSLPP